MIVDGTPRRSIWWSDDHRVLQIIDQRHLPHRFIVEDLATTEGVFTAIREMHVRGAPLIGAAAGYGVAFAVADAKNGASADDAARAAAARLLESRPTAINLAWAVERVLAAVLKAESPVEKKSAADKESDRIVEEEVDRCRRIGEYGLAVVEELARGLDRPVNILTHCNAGWLACVDYGTATAPIYLAHDRGIPVHVWVDETRPRNQGARLTAWELGQHGIPHTVIVDNAGGHLMQQELVDLVLVGSDRTTRRGDVINKIGTYQKALAAYDNDVPFYVALPSSSIDWSMSDGRAAPIEQRDRDEVRYVQGWADGRATEVLVTPPDSPAANYAFDVTPARLVTGLITERGVCEADPEAMLSLFPEANTNG
ncbi:MAG: S-methyl-5-thioribose-1-phosphate isomerase [Rhodothermales bacterium]|nr:S-methyl-5-thioribose-1-phosphate isomerase [Rhodothermales bacterium]